MGDIKYAAVGISALIGFFFLGGLWYSKKVFAYPWARASGMLDDQGNFKGLPPGEHPKAKHPGRVFAMAFAFAIVSAIAFGWMLPHGYTFADALVRGVVVGAAIVAASFGINYQFGQKPTVLWLIDAGYHTLQFTIYGLVFGLLT